MRMLRYIESNLMHRQLLLSTSPTTRADPRLDRGHCHGLEPIVDGL